MHNSKSITLVLSILTLTLFVLASASTAAAQRRDYMSEAEIEIIRDAQDIDTRIEVLTRMIDRRFAVLRIEVGGWKQAKKESDAWGEMPKGTRLELFSDIKKLLQKAIDDIDNLAAHPNAAPIRDKEEKNSKEAKKDPQRFGLAVRKLGQAAGRYLTPLKSTLDKATDEKEKGLLLDSIDFCNQIIDAVGKLPPESKKK